jgi:serine protease AprX
MRKSYLIVFAALLIGAVTVGWKAVQPLETWQDKIDAELLERALQGGDVEFIVTMNGKADLSEARWKKTKEERGAYVFQQLSKFAQQAQSDIQLFLRSSEAPFRPFYILNGLYVEGDLTLIQALAERSDVQFIHDNTAMEMLRPVENNDAVQLRTIEWGIDMINADEVWAMGYRGEGVIVGGQDTGYEWEHPALIEQYKGWNGADANHNYHWHDAIHEISPLHNDPVVDPSNNPCGLDVDYPCDDHNHGTHTMGTMVGEDGDNQIGVAPKASWIACRNMERGYGSPATYIECFEWFLAPTDLNDENPDPSKAPHVIANSWSCPEIEGCNPNNFALMQAAVENLKAAGVVVVVSAGNSGSQGCSSVNTPSAIFENSFTVGATNQQDSIAGFSSRGPVDVDNSLRLKPNVSAPGVGVRSCIRDGQYASYNGTSMAGPHVAGAVALLISANPELAGQVELIETILEETAVSKQTEEDCGNIDGENIPNNTYGFGRIDIKKAVDQALELLDVQNGKPRAELDVELFPNPVSDQLSLRYVNLIGSAMLTLTDMQGREIFRYDWVDFNQGQIDIDISKLPAGAYFYKFRNMEQQRVGKVIKQ